MTTSFRWVFGAALFVAGVALLVAGSAMPVRGDGIMLVTAGAFWMGRDDGSADEAPRHRVYVADFWIEREKVTASEFAEFLNAEGTISPERERRYDEDESYSPIHLVRLGMPSHPKDGQPVRWIADPGHERSAVTGVSWFGARDFCRSRGRRLPTEAEWEKAARGSHGVEDLLGASREWTSTTLKPYPYRHDDGREPFVGRGRVVARGERSATSRRSYDRSGAAIGYHDVSFRCATSEDLGGY